MVRVRVMVRMRTRVRVRVGLVLDGPPDVGWIYRSASLSIFHLL